MFVATDSFAAQIHNKSSAVAGMGDHGHDRHKPNEGTAVPLLRGGGGFPTSRLT